MKKHVPQKNNWFNVQFRSSGTLALFLVGALLPGVFTSGLAESTGNLAFKQNKGQWEKEVLYRADIAGGALFATKQGISMVFVHPDDAKSIHPGKSKGMPLPGMMRLHALMMKFENGAINPVVIPENQLTGHSNYFTGNDREKWASNIKSYGSLLYKDVWPGINLKMYSELSDFKYDFIIKPGGDPARISLRYEGADDMSIVNGKLQIRTSVGTIEELKPVTYQIINGKKVFVKCNFKLESKKVSFDLPEGYSRMHELIIDPILVFASYTGSSADNWGYTATYDIQGNLYAGGIATTLGFPVTPGAFQQVFGGGGSGGNTYPFDAVVTKFSSNGTTLLYSTYLGGSDNEQPHSMEVNSLGELVVMGRTYSTNFPVTSFAYDNSYNGAGDIFVCRFDSTGSNLIASTFIGGTGEDGVNTSAAFFTMTQLKYNYGDDSRSELKLGLNDEIYVAASTRSSDFPVTISAFQQTFGGIQDGVIFKLSPDLSTLVWSSFLGGIASDAAFSVALDNNNDLYVAGATMSNDFPVTPSGLNTGFLGGIADGYVVKIAGNGSGILHGTYIGTGAFDNVCFVALDVLDDVYLLGQTQGAIPVSAGKYGNPNSGVFVQKLTSDLGQSVFTTTIGTGNMIPNISPTAFMIDNCQRIFLAGWGRCLNIAGDYPSSQTTGMPITANAIQNTTDGCDFYMAVLGMNANKLEFATFFGGTQSFEHVDGGTSRFDPNGVIYQSVCAGCGGNSDFPTTPGVWSNTNNSTNCNIGVLKISLDAILATSSFNPSLASGCAPLTINFTNQSTGATNFFWDFGNGMISSFPNPTIVFNIPGTYMVTLVASDLGTCNVSDTSYATITVYAPVTANAGPDLSICTGDQVQMNATGGVQYLWSPSTGLSNDSIPDPVASPLVTTTYIVSVSNGFCDQTDTVTVFVNPFPIADAGPDKAICPGGSVQLFASGGTSYSWDPPIGLSNHLVNNPIASPSGTTQYVVYVTANGCTSTDTVSVLVSLLPVISAGPDQTINAGSSTNLLATGGVSFQWTPDSTLSCANCPDPVATPLITTTYHVVVIDSNGCTGSDSVTVFVKPLPETLFIPNVMTVNGDSRNDLFNIKAADFAKFDLKLFNRWGVLVFESDHHSNQWDGIVQNTGKEAPAGVYYYLLNLVSNTGEPASYKGYLTLIR